MVEYAPMIRLLLTTAVLCTLSPSATAATNVVLTTTAELRALSEDNARRGLRFDLTAQVIQKTPGITGCAFVVQDESGGVHVFTEDNPRSFAYSPGDVILWRGNMAGSIPTTRSPNSRLRQRPRADQVVACACDGKPPPGMPIASATAAR